MWERLVELVVGADAAAASLLHVVHLAVYRVSVIPRDETPTGKSCKTEQVQQRHRWSPSCDVSNSCATAVHGHAGAIQALYCGLSPYGPDGPRQLRCVRRASLSLSA